MQWSKFSIIVPLHVYRVTGGCFNLAIWQILYTKHIAKLAHLRRQIKNYQLGSNGSFAKHNTPRSYSIMNHFFACKKTVAPPWLIFVLIFVLPTISGSCSRAGGKWCHQHAVSSKIGSSLEHRMHGIAIHGRQSAVVFSPVSEPSIIILETAA